LRKLNCSPLDRYEKPTFRLGNPLVRFQVATMANTARLRSSPRKKVDTDLALPPRDAHSAGIDVAEEQSEATQIDDAKSGMEVGDAQFTDPEKLKKALSMGSSSFPDHVWHLYQHLHPDVKDQYTMDVLRYLAVASWIPKPREFYDMVSSLDPFFWSPELADAGIRAALSLDDLEAALNMFNRALDIRAWSQGMDQILAYCLRQSRWEELHNLWGTCRERLGSGDLPNVDYRLTVEIPDLSTKLSAFWGYLRSQDADKRKLPWPAMRDIFNSVLKSIAAKSMEHLSKGDATFILEHLDEPVLYEEFIKLCVRREDYRLASDLYQRYRKLPDVRIRIPVLQHMLDVYYPNNDHGMEMVLKDWLGRYDKLNYIASRKFIRFYAIRGDVDAVFRLWEDHKSTAGHRKAYADKWLTKALLDVYAVRGEVKKARRVFHQLTWDRGQRPTTLQYNMLLSAHAEAWDLHGALRTFSELCKNAEPNNYSYGYLMGITGSRGNLQLTLGLYKMARDEGILPDVAMVNAMVDAYCVNDQMSAAETLCSITTTRRVLPEEVFFRGMKTTPYTILWNTVLRHYAERHDLTNVNRILQDMSNLKIPYDGKTYEYLLLALIRVNQSAHALQLIEISEQKDIFMPTVEHYLLLMSGYLATREPTAVMKISRMMAERNFPDSAEKMTKLMEAFGLWSTLPTGQRLGTPAHYFLEAALTAFRKSLGREERTARDDLRAVAEQYSKMIGILTQARDFATIPEIVALYESQFPENSTPETMPIKLLNTLMRADFHERKFDRVMATWNTVYNKVIALSGHPASESVLDEHKETLRVAPAHRHLLNPSLATVFKVYEATGDGQGLVALVGDVLDAGFELGQQNWNRYIQLLAHFGQWKDAFLLCEENLMPQWQGWARVRKVRRQPKLPLDTRRMGRYDRYTRPNTHTLLILMKQLMELEQRAPWSSAEGKLLEEVNEKCPRLIRAAKTMIPTGSELERDIFEKDVAIEGDEDILRYIMKDEDFLQPDEVPELAYAKDSSSTSNKASAWDLMEAASRAKRR
jgi:pentatricopeptide repeat-containing protein PET309